MNKKGLSLIELLVVVMLLSIFATIAFPNILNFANEASDSVNKTNITSLISAAEAYYYSNNIENNYENVNLYEKVPGDKPKVGYVYVQNGTLIAAIEYNGDCYTANGSSKNITILSGECSAINDENIEF